MKFNHEFDRDDDDHLVRFLKGHEPSPLVPPAAKHEEVLMDLLVMPDQHAEARSQTAKKLSRSRLTWLVPTAIAASLVVMVGQFKAQQSFSPTPQLSDTTTKSLLKGRVTVDQELETFLMDSWHNSLGEQPTPPETIHPQMSDLVVDTELRPAP